VNVNGKKHIAQIAGEMECGFTDTVMGSEGLAACRTMAYASCSWAARRHIIDMKCCVLGERRTGSNTGVLQGKAAHALHWRPARMSAGDLSGRTLGGSRDADALDHEDLTTIVRLSLSTYR
jgi:hypothetical protein